MRRNLLLLSVVTAFCLVIMEVALRVIAPARPATIGTTDAPNAAYYGWGFAPHSVVHIIDPDTGVVYSDTLNAGGWRDAERTLAKPPGTFRIVAIGDSVTYGATVGQKDTWTAQLERKLSAAGARAEVINIAYAGWGTDQELEALVREGLAYKPDLVIVQFCVNDPDDNAFFNSPDPAIRARKPVYYDLDASGAAVRHDNPLFNDPESVLSLHDRVVRVAEHSAILKTIVNAHRVRALRARANASVRADGSRVPPSYRVAPSRVEHVRLALKLEESAPLIVALRGRVGSMPTEEELIQLIDRAGETGRRETVLRLLEDRWFLDSWTPAGFKSAHPFDLQGIGWRLTAALLRRMNDNVRAAGAKFAILNETEQGHLEWCLAWHEFEDTPANHDSFLAHERLLADVAQGVGAFTIPNHRPYERARNDPHENARGYDSMSSDVLDFLREQPGLVPGLSR